MRRIDGWRKIAGVLTQPSGGGGMTIVRAAFAVVLALSLLATPLVADAQPPAKVPRVGYLDSEASLLVTQRLRETFRQGLRDLGYVEGQNIALEIRSAEGRLERLPALASELARLKVDIIVAAGGDASVRAAKQATSTIPIVMTLHPDPEGTGIVASLAHPGGNITGLSILATEVGGKRLELLKKVVPRASRVAVLWNPANRAKVREMDATRAAAGVLGVGLRPVEVRGPEDFAGGFRAVAAARADALVTFVETLTISHHREIVAFALKNRLPMISELNEFTEAGGLMSYGASRRDLWRRAAAYVDKILKGAKPADLPVEQPTKFELVINLKTAKALGLTIPPSVLAQADQVIE